MTFLPVRLDVSLVTFDVKVDAGHPDTSLTANVERQFERLVIEGL